MKRDRDAAEGGQGGGRRDAERGQRTTEDRFRDASALGRSLPAPYERVNYISGVHVDDEDGVVFLSVVSAQGRGDPSDQLINLPVHLPAVVLHGLLLPLLHFAEDIFHLPGPPHLAGGQHHHPLVQEHPVDPKGKARLQQDFPRIGTENGPVKNLILSKGNPVVNWYSYYGEQYGASFKKLKIELPYDPAIPLLDIYPEKTILRKDTCTPMFTAARFTIAKTWRQPKWPSTN